MYVLDVGQADSILLMGPDFTILIDAGKRERGVVVSYLREIGVESIDLLVGTHPHADHIGQFAEVLQTFPVSEVWMSGDTNTTATFEAAIDAIAESGAGYHEPRAGEVFQLGSARIEVLNPTHLTGEANEGSVMFRLIFGDVAFMFTGDAEAPTEREVIDSGRDLRAQILKLGHHGSDTSSTLAFLLAVEPKLALWSAGLDNTYGHPSPKTLDNLAMLGVRTLGTMDEGTIVVSTDGTSYEVLDYEGEDFEKTLAGTPEATPTRTPTPRPATSGCAPGQVNINTATEEELEEITQIGPARAALMIELRPFTSVDDMVRVSGITETALGKIKEQGLACVE
jgi:beta-lactamase superfamily II metal-dependent hydrolase